MFVWTQKTWDLNVFFYGISQPLFKEGAPPSQRNTPKKVQCMIQVNKCLFMFVCGLFCAAEETPTPVHHHSLSTPCTATSPGLLELNLTFLLVKGLRSSIIVSIQASPTCVCNQTPDSRERATCLSVCIVITCHFCCFSS